MWPYTGLVIDEEAGADRSDLTNVPIFVLGILPRCGTNFLSDLLCLHPECGQPTPIWEDFLVAHADILEKYVDATVGRWDPAWGVEGDVRDRLARALGDGLSSFLSGRTRAARIVTKTPRVENLKRFFTFFPGAKMLILVRDGRAILESGINTFGWHRDTALHRLAAAAKTVIEFDDHHCGSRWRDSYRIVRYEDLWSNLEEELRGILRFVGLDAGCYDFAAAQNMPIRGSSTVRGEKQGSMHWKPVRKTADFDPMSRFRHWTRAQHERFNRVAGSYFEPLGYEAERFSGGRVYWAIWNAILDLKWHIVRVLGPVGLKIKRGLR